MGMAIDIVDKMSDLISDLFSADDSYIVDTSAASTSVKSPGSTSSNYFRSTATTIDNLPLLKTDMIKKIIKQLNLVNTKGKGVELFEDLEEEGVGRLLKTLERSWRGCEELTYWSKDALRTKEEKAAPAESGTKKGGKQAKKSRASPVNKRGRRGSRLALDEDDDDDDEENEDDEEYREGGKRSTRTANRGSSRSRSRTPAVTSREAGVDVEMMDPREDAVWTETSLHVFAIASRSFSDALLAIRAALILLTLIHLPKQLYSADFISSIVISIRHNLDNFIYPLLEAAPDSHLGDLVHMRSGDISLVCEELNAAIPLIAKLVRQEETSEEIVTSMIYCALSPFFHEGSSNLMLGAMSQLKKGENVKSTTAEKGMKGIRMASLGWVRSLYAKYEDQRAWIIEEVLSNLTKLEFTKKGKGTLK